MSQASEIDGETNRPGLRVEVFVSDVSRAMAFYRDVLGFQVLRAAPGGYTSMARETAVIGLNEVARMAPGHPARPEPGRAVGRGVELVVMVEDVAAAHAQAAAASAGTSPLAVQPWGLTDFRVVDPDGYYIRVTGLSTGS